MPKTSLLRAAASLLALAGLGAASPASGGPAPAELRVIRADLDGDRDPEVVSVRRVSPAGFSQLRVTIDDPRTAGVGRLGPALDRIGRLSVRDFARIGRPQVFMDGSSGASGRFYAAALGRWTGARVRVLWRYDTGHARTPAGTAVGSAVARIAGRQIRLREFLVPPDDPGCCPSFVRTRVSRYDYRPKRGVYVLARRATGPPQRPATR